MDHVILLKEHLKDLNSRGEHTRGIPSEITDKTETEVQEVFERKKPLVAEELLAELRESEEQDFTRALNAQSKVPQSFWTAA